MPSGRHVLKRVFFESSFARHFFPRFAFLAQPGGPTGCLSCDGAIFWVALGGGQVAGRCSLPYGPRRPLLDFFPPLTNFCAEPSGRSRRVVKASARALEAVALSLGPKVDDEQDVASDEFAVTPPRVSAGRGKRSVPSTPGSAPSPSAVEAQPAGKKTAGRGLVRRPSTSQCDARDEGAPRGRGRPLKEGGNSTAKPLVVISQATEELLVRAQMFPAVCMCEVAAHQPASQLKALARRIEDDRRSKGGERSKYPVTKAEAIAFICPPHLGDVAAVNAVINRDLGPRTTLERLMAIVNGFMEQWGRHDGVPTGKGLTVTTAYIWYLMRVLRPSRFQLDSPVDAVFVSLVPHLVRDLLVNHNWHIVQGFRRVGAKGTRQLANGLGNMAEFSAIMLFCVAHYAGDHAECGLTRTNYGVCVETINIAMHGAVIMAATDAATKIVSFVASHQVTDVSAVYPNQPLLINHFGQM